jgi:hypothetical protein
MVRLLAIAALVLAGCEARLGEGVGSSSVDASGGDGSDSGGGSNDAALSVDAAPACATGRKVYLNFDGVTITRAANSDSTMNLARWLTNTSAAVPPWRQGSATRVADILAIVDGVEQRLAMTPIEVVTTRPGAGPYVMIVFGGANLNTGGTVGTQYAFATSYHDCNDGTKNDLGWVSNMTGQNNSFIADIAVGAIGWGLGLDGTTDPTGCMCGWANGCSSAPGACTLSSSITTSITNGETVCTNGTQNEVAAFTTGFCAP